MNRGCLFSFHSCWLQHWLWMNIHGNQFLITCVYSDPCWKQELLRNTGLRAQELLNKYHRDNKGIAWTTGKFATTTASYNSLAIGALRGAWWFSIRKLIYFGTDINFEVWQAWVWREIDIINVTLRWMVPVFRFFEYVNFERKEQKVNSTS